MKARVLERKPLPSGDEIICLIAYFLGSFACNASKQNVGVHKPRHFQAKEAIMNPVAHV